MYKTITEICYTSRRNYLYCYTFHQNQKTVSQNLHMTFVYIIKYMNKAVFILCVQRN